jgi:hypothetical protein
MELKQEILQHICMCLVNLDGMTQAIEEESEDFGFDGTAMDDVYLAMSRDDISGLMHNAFMAHDSLLWGCLEAHYLNKCSTEELGIFNLTISILTKVFAKGVLSPFTCANGDEIVFATYGLAKLVIESRPVAV